MWFWLLCPEKLFVIRIDELPGHEFLLHVLFSVESPGQTEDFFERDIFRDGTSHARFLICSPPPQVFVHVDHSPQLDHSETKLRELLVICEIEHELKNNIFY